MITRNMRKYNNIKKNVDMSVKLPRIKGLHTRYMCNWKRNRAVEAGMDIGKKKKSRTTHRLGSTKDYTK